MGLVINPRGTSGAGKTWLVRAVMEAYGGGEAAEPLHRPGRRRPMGWRLSHPGGGRLLAVIGDYGRTRGGTDTIPLDDGGLAEAFRLADILAGGGHDVLLEGLQLSGERHHTAALAAAQRARGSVLHVLCLEVPLEQCIRNVLQRRRAGSGARLTVERTARAGQDALAEACAALRQSGATVEWLDRADALRRTLALLRVHRHAAAREAA